MRSVSVVAGLTGLFLFAPGASQGQAPPHQEASTIEGRVVNAATGDPLGKAAVTLTPTDGDGAFKNGERNYTATSDSAGSFAIRDIEPGEYRLHVSRQGYLLAWYGARRPEQQGTVIDLRSATDMKAVEIRLTRQGVITGRVLDADGEPFEGARVQLLRSQYVSGKRTPVPKNDGITNDLGEYRFAGLAPGKYFLYARHTESQPLPPETGETYAATYYPNALDAASAVPIDVNAGGSFARATSC
jgi:protocatechuate 3,4-dioxygenase beta subunit